MKLNNKDLMKKHLLTKKIKEHFLKNPKSNSVLIKTNLGGKTLWNVVREGKNNFQITEVNTKRKQFLLEAPAGAFGGPSPVGNDQPNPIGGQTQAQPAQQAPQGQAQQQPVQQTPQQQQQAFSQLPLNDKISQLANGQMLNYQTSIATLGDMLKSQGQNVAQLRGALEAGLGLAKVDANQKRQIGDLLNILTSVSNGPTLTAGKKIKGKNLKEEDLKKKDNEESAVETTSDDQETNLDNALTKNHSAEEALLVKCLIGQTIRDADIETSSNGGKLSLGMVSLKNPIELEWFNNGKIILNYKGRPYTISRNLDKQRE
jgi:hypothetical protein